MEKHLEYDKWLSTILKREVYRLIVDDGLVKDAEHNHETLISRLTTGHLFVYAKVHTTKLEEVFFLEKLGFRLIETNVVFEKAVYAETHFAWRPEIRFAVAKDRHGVESVARNNFLYSRFHLDPLIPSRIANQIKAKWAINYFNGNRGDNMVVALNKGEVVGFLQLLYNGEEELVIDLISVDKRSQSKGVARNMIAFAESNLKNFNRIRVGTQIANIPSMRLYESIGFRITTSNYVFHYFYP